MFRRFSVNFAIFSICYDAVWVMVSLGLASYLRPYLNRLDFAKPIISDINTPLPLYPLFALIWILVLLLFSVYDGRRNIKAVDEFSTLALGTILASITSAGLLYITYRDVSRLLFIVFVLISFLGLFIWRLAYRLSLRWGGFKPDDRKVLILGAGEIGQRTRAQLQDHQKFGIRFRGFLDDEIDIPEVIGYLQETRKIVNNQKIDDVIIALPRPAYERVNQLVAELHDLPVRVWVIPDYFSLILHQAAVENFAGIPMLDLRAPALNEYQRLIKRIFDLAFTFILLPILMVLLAVIAIIIKITDLGPAFFLQERVGENGKIFKVYKFRTMVEDAESRRHEVESIDENGNLIHKKSDDPRITPIGRFLRRSSLDELPNVINVIKGDMSWVGPRPELPYHVEKYEVWQRTRFAMPPGITGWWQISGRSDKPMHLNTEDDIYYVQHYSPWLDIYILWKTIWVVIKGKGAY